MTDTAIPVAQKPPVSTWISLGALVISLGGVGMVVLGQFFAPRDIQTTIAVIEERYRHLDWKVETIRVGQINTAAQVQTLNVNVAKLLERRGIEPEPAPALMAAPPRPER